MSPERHEGGVPHAKKKLSASSGGASVEESWPGANAEKAVKLRLRSLRRRAGAEGFGLRHSDYGYALIDATGRPVNDRNNMSLAEVESWLKRAL